MTRGVYAGFMSPDKEPSAPDYQEASFMRHMGDIALRPLRAVSNFMSELSTGLGMPEGPKPPDNHSDTQDL
jgi:hypothetical protein